jgi:putative superfamily III holin-X
VVPGGRLPERAAASLTTTELVREITSHVGLLVKRQVELAKTELKADLHTEVGTVRNLGIAALAALLTLNLLLVTAALALSLVMPGWAAGLVVSGFTLLIAVVVGLIGWQKRIRRPLARSRQALEDEIKWTKERLA